MVTKNSHKNFKSTTFKILVALSLQLKIKIK